MQAFRLVSQSLPKMLCISGRQRLQRTKASSFVPFSPHMSPKTDGKPVQFKSYFYLKSILAKRMFFCVSKKWLTATFEEEQRRE